MSYPTLFWLDESASSVAHVRLGVVHRWQSTLFTPK